MAEKKVESTFVEPSASGPVQKVGRDGVVSPGKLGQAQEGSVSNPGVRSVGTAATDPRCPSCGNSSLKMRMNRKAGQRVYCSNPECDYDQGTQNKRGTVTVNPSTKVVSSSRGADGDRGVKVIRQSRSG
jgi:predicted RNA-binding Zn-ribbon protein involved in translation (DUF1610 family)